MHWLETLTDVYENIFAYCFTKISIKYILKNGRSKPEHGYINKAESSLHGFNAETKRYALTLLKNEA